MATNFYLHRKRQKAGYWQLRLLERLALTMAQHEHDWSQRDFDRYQDVLYAQFHALIDLDPDARVPRELLARLERELPVRPTDLARPRALPHPASKGVLARVLARVNS